jgi:hypothetical protein
MRSKHEIEALLNLMKNTKSNCGSEVVSLSGNVVDQTIGVLKWVLEKTD